MGVRDGGYSVQQAVQQRRRRFTACQRAKLYGAVARRQIGFVPFSRNKAGNLDS